MPSCADTNFTITIYTKLHALLSMKKSISEHCSAAEICLIQRTGIANICLEVAFFTELLKSTPLYRRGRVYYRQREI